MRLLSVLLLLNACAQFRPPDRGVAEPRATSSDPCAIEDAEDGDDRIVVRAGRGGYLYTYQDARGTKIAPAGEFAVTRGGVDGSRYSLRMTGSVADAAETYAGIGLGFREPKAPYDASRFRGITFAARRGAGTAAAVRVKLPDVNTDPDGGQCSECYNDFGIDFQVAEEWKRYQVSFADLSQQPGWGEPRPSAVDTAKLYGVQWQVTTPGAEVDLWIDDVRFAGCNEAP